MDACYRQGRRGRGFPHEFRPRRAWVLGLVLTALSCHSFHFENAPIAEKVPHDTPPLPPGKKECRLGHYLFLSDFELNPSQPLFVDLAGLGDQVYKELRLPPSSSIVKVFLFEDRDRYERFMHARYPDLPKRRAFFVAQPRGMQGGEDLLVYTYWGERIQQDLRHELTHALLHGVLKDVPLWLDEGLAEFFELPAASDGLNSTHLDYLRRGSGGPTQLDLARLEQLSQVQQMAPAEYREAWAWVHLFLRDSPDGKTVLLNYLQQLRQNPNPGPLRPGLVNVYPVPEDALSKHLARLDASSAKAPQPQPTP